MNRAEKRRQKKLAAKTAKGQKTAPPNPDSPDHQAASLSLAVQHHAAGRLDEAEKIYRQILQANPDDPSALNLLGTIANQMGHHESAVSLISKAVSIKPSYVTAYCNLGNAFQGLGKMDEAISSYHKALELQPDLAEAFYNLGSAYKDLERSDEAVANYLKAIEIRPDYAEAHNNVGIVYRNMGNHDAATASHQKAIDLNPQFSEAHYNLGNVFRDQKKHDEAQTCYETALALNPEFADAHSNLGITHRDKGDFERALKHLQKAIGFKSGFADAHYNLGLLQFLLGDFKNGWINYAWRMQREDPVARIRNYNEPVIKEQDDDGRSNQFISLFEGKNILVWMEQGVGDEISFASMLGDLSRVAGKVVVECDDRMLPLFNRSFPNIDFVARTEPPTDDLTNGDFDFKIPAGHLGLYYRQDANGAPQPRAYFRPDPEKQAAIRDIYTNRWPGKRLIGFSWRSGNPTVGQERSISLDQLIPVLSNQDCQFINLQYDATDKDFVALEEKTGIKIYCDPLVDPMQDLDGLAAQVAALDLVISTTNTTVHMSGAVGVPTWVLLPRVPDWRWQLGRSDSLWYPNMQLFRREKNEPWETVIDRIQKRLMKGPQ